MLTELKNGKPGIIAKQIEMDFLKKGLRSGDRYFSANEVSVMFGISQSTADRAMRILSGQNKLVRKPRGGTFIGPGVSQPDRMSKINAVYVFFSAGMEEALSFDIISKCIYENFSNVGIQLISIPSEGGFNYFREIVDGAIERGNLLGSVLICGTREMYSYLNKHNIKSVVFGTLYSDQDFFISTDRDSTQSARLLVNYLVNRGRRKLLILIKNVGRAGSDQFIDSIYGSASMAGLSPADIKIRICNGNPEETVARINELFINGSSPDGIIVDGEYMLNLVEKVCANQDLVLNEDIEVVFEAGAIFNIRPQKYAHTCVMKEKEIFISELISKLRELTEGRSLPCEHIVLPVKLVEPK
ncbi:hypothetical protein SMSP2_00851 [Limihaloglobus sulfuriphilus]|uniref:HTH gntR-type domain-containing protein n=1 Tax=Limihaloglobus sulfuriphilus TaxID=1851148 RepID=A0A1Q2MCX3_9BACT|nr:GntR family transcriptional regulator [Limihaloglobus sulfuriphilus]AQQ70499.1 hypothetical protein SMSP2_00851 [Limihaloglobus sulfuriphilus]